MPWPKSVKLDALLLSERSCCVCHQFKGRNIELHHIVAEAEGGSSDLANCIPLCPDCHAEAGHYNLNHPRGTKYSPDELRRHRDAWFAAVSERRRLQASRLVDNTLFEQQQVRLIGSFERRRFAVPPHFLDPEVEGNEGATYWILAIDEPFNFRASSSSRSVASLQLCLSAEQYAAFEPLMGRRVVVQGKLDKCISAHHHGDALLWVDDIEDAADD